MMDVNLIAVAPVPTDSEVSVIEENTSEQLIEHSENQSEDLELASDSFVILMTQILAEPEARTPSAKEEATTNISEEEGPSIIQNDSSTPSLQKTNSLSDNVAMTWINSESFIPPQLNALAEQEDDEPITLDALQIHDEPELLPVNNASNSSHDASKHESLSDLKQNILVDLMQADSNNYSSKPMLTRLETPDNSNISLKPDFMINTETNMAYPAYSYSQFNQQMVQNPIPNSPNLSIPVHVADTQWADQFSEHIVWMGQNNVNSALIKLHPEELGPLEITVKVVKDSASVNITSHNGQVRDLVEQAFPKLKEMMADQGILLSEAHIGADENTRQSNQQNYSPNQDALDTSIGEDVKLTPITKKSSMGLIDYFA